jgi:hypothetical protein
MEADLIPFINTAPNLASLSLEREDTPDDIPQEFNYSQLSHMNFVPTQAGIQNLFEKCPNLLSLQIEESLAQHYSGAVGPMIIIGSSRLETLNVCQGHFDQSDASDSVFPLLRLPSLKTLNLEASKHKRYLKRSSKPRIDGKFWIHFEPFMVFIKQSSFQLTSFSIQQLSISDANLVDILVHLPTLQNLTVDDSGVSPEYSSISSGFIDSLHSYRTSSLRPQEPPIIPQLRSLRLLNVGVTTFSDMSVVEMVQSRWNPSWRHDVGTSTSTLEVDCLRVFTMTFLNRPEADAGGVYNLLDPIERDGMMIIVQMLG